MSVKMAEKEWFNAKRFTGVLAIVSFVSGFIFLNQDVTGNTIISDVTRPSLSPVSIVGLIFILCSAILTFYSIRKQ